MKCSLRTIAATGTSRSVRLGSCSASSSFDPRRITLVGAGQSRQLTKAALQCGFSSDPRFEQTRRFSIYPGPSDRSLSSSRPEQRPQRAGGPSAPTSTPRQAKKSTRLLLLLQRTAFAYLLGISLCLAWSAARGWYLVLNDRGDELDGRSPLRIAWDATRWPVDACSRLLNIR